MLTTGEHFEKISAMGGKMNGVTGKDVSTYYQTVPSHHLEAVLWVADRMRCYLIV